jgi:putative flippase GtrA
MIKIFISKFWLLRAQFMRYFIIGFSAFILDIGSLYLLKEYGHVSPVVAVIINQLFILNYVFFLNKHWSFKAVGITHRQLVKFFLLATGNYLISIAWMWLLNHQLKIFYLYVRISNVVLAVTWNFLLYKYWVYRPHTNEIVG